MSDQPLPDDVDVDELGDRYVLVPYAFQFPSAEAPLPVACIIYDKEAEALKSFVMGVDGTWNQLMDPVSVGLENVIDHTSDSIYQSILGVIGEPGMELQSIKTKLNEFVDIYPEITTDSRELAKESDPTEAFLEFCSCDSPEVNEDTVIDTGSDVVYFSSCLNCREVYEVRGVQENETVFNFSSSEDMKMIDLIEPYIQSENIILTEEEDMYLYTQPSWSFTPIIGIAMNAWWGSQKENTSSRQYVPTENNLTLVIQDRSVKGVLIWSYVLGSLPIVHHVRMDPMMDGESVNMAFNSWQEGLEAEAVYIEEPYELQDALSGLFESMVLVSGSIQFETID